jgi:hypothetical protein
MLLLIFCSQAVAQTSNQIFISEITNLLVACKLVASDSDINKKRTERSRKNAFNKRKEKVKRLVQNLTDLTDLGDITLGEKIADQSIGKVAGVILPHPTPQDAATLAQIISSQLTSSSIFTSQSLQKITLTDSISKDGSSRKFATYDCASTLARSLNVNADTKFSKWLESQGYLALKDAFGKHKEVVLAVGVFSNSLADLFEPPYRKPDPNEFNAYLDVWFGNVDSNNYLLKSFEGLLVYNYSDNSNEQLITIKGQGNSGATLPFLSASLTADIAQNNYGRGSFVAEGFDLYLSSNPRVQYTKLPDAQQIFRVWNKYASDRRSKNQGAMKVPLTEKHGATTFIHYGPVGSYVKEVIEDLPNFKNDIANNENLPYRRPFINSLELLPDGYAIYEIKFPPNPDYFKSRNLLAAGAAEAKLQLKFSHEKNGTALIHDYDISFEVIAKPTLTSSRSEIEADLKREADKIYWEIEFDLDGSTSAPRLMPDYVCENQNEQFVAALDSDGIGLSGERYRQAMSMLRRTYSDLKSTLGNTCKLKLNFRIDDVVRAISVPIQLPPISDLEREEVVANEAERSPAIVATLPTAPDTLLKRVSELPSSNVSTNDTSEVIMAIDIETEKSTPIKKALDQATMLEATSP